MPTEPRGRFSLSRRTVLITGAGKGIGKVYALELARAHARVIVADIDAAAAEKTASELTGQGHEALGLHVDIADEASVNAMVRAGHEKFGSIDVLVNNASLMSTLQRRSWMEIPIEEWDRVMDVNLRGTFLCARAVFPIMQAQRSGKIINISSSRIWDGTPFRLHYTTSKAGIVGFTRALAREVGEFGINVNAITPGLTLSDSQVGSSSSGYLDSKSFADRALKRPQVPDDLVGAVMFLASSASDFMTGQTLNVDGGKSMH